MNEHDNVFDLNAILHPGSVFDHPRDVAADLTISAGEKRHPRLQGLGSCRRSVHPPLRELPGSHPVTIDEILEAVLGP